MFRANRAVCLVISGIERSDSVKLHFVIFMNPKIIHFANTFVGKRGNIGVRTAHVLNHLSQLELASECVCRGSVVTMPGVKFDAMGLFGHFPRALNALRMYVIRGYNHRPLDIRFFEMFSLLQLARSNYQGRFNVAHVWDTCPRLIKRLKRDGLSVVLDVPIAPQTYGKRMKEAGRAQFLSDSERLIEIELESFHLADVLIAPSGFVYHELVRAGVDERKIKVVEFGVDTPENFCLDPRSRIGHAGAPIRYAFVGLINQRKGVPELLQAWSVEEFKNDQLHLCGRLFPDIRRKLPHTGGGEIITPGFVRTHEYLSKCDVFVFPSWMEGSAKAVLEAMACGLPAIVTESAGSVVRDGIDGFIVEPGDSKALRDRMLWFKNNPKEIAAMGANAASHARELTWYRYARKVFDVYMSVVH